MGFDTFLEFIAVGKNWPPAMLFRLAQHMLFLAHNCYVRMLGGFMGPLPGSCPESRVPESRVP